MAWKEVLSFVFFIVAAILLFFYWMAPFENFNFESFQLEETNYNFTLNSVNFSDNEMQFYPNMRFPNQRISYKIEGCSLNKEDDMERAFEIVEEKTILDFYEKTLNEEIYVTCDSRTKVEGRLFIAGEGGPTEIINAGNFNVIKKGKILLLRESKCENPNVGIHELFHVLGFDHSSNPKNIMYNFSNCNQEISQDIIDTINNLYSLPSETDLSIQNASAFMHGRYLDINFTVKNIGLKEAKNSTVKIYADEKIVDEFKIEKLDIGYGRIISAVNIFIIQSKIDELKFVLDYPDTELNKENNKIVLKVKK